jgi:hypothetical protein
VNLEGSPGLRQRLERNVRAPGLHVVKDGVAMAEGPALDVLAREPDADGVGEDGRQRELLGCGPVDRPLVGVVEDRRALLASALELAMDVEV